jgi:hypothetical protein
MSCRPRSKKPSNSPSLLTIPPFKKIHDYIYIYDEVQKGPYRILSKSSISNTCAARSISERIGNYVKPSGVVEVFTDSICHFEQLLLTRISLRERASRVQRRNVCQNAVLGRAHGMTHLL